VTIVTQPLTAAPDIAVLVERLTTHKTLGSAPRSELEWLARNAEFRRYEVGARVASKGDPVDDMIVQLSGRLTVSMDRGSGRRQTLDSFAGEVTALLPFSRLTSALGDATFTEASEILALPREKMPALIRECPGIVEILVHNMVDRSKHLASANWQDDKMASLGRLAAGLAHELNNPASAAARSAKQLRETLKEVDAAARAVGAATLTEAQRKILDAYIDGPPISMATGVYSAIERADQEDEISDWLDDHDADSSRAAALAETGITTRTLDDLADSFEGTALDVALRWIAAEHTARTLATEVERATTRIHDLVSAVKRFTYLNRAATPAPTDVAQGLADTVAVVASKARGKSVSVKLEVQPGLPAIIGNAGELNQVWANLIENAIDAANANGKVTVKATKEDGDVVVRVIDDGPGIPADIQTRIFEPFFTTKPIGQGTGLGLDISRRVVASHEGSIVLESRPGRTEFRVALPLEQKKA
jgi:signal transduction histidine kinase